MLRFQDFEPRQTDGGFLREPQYESLDTVLERLNEWVKQYDLHVVNIETVVLPNIHNRREEGTADVDVRTSSDFGNTWHQFFRLWYRT